MNVEEGGELREGEKASERARPKHESLLCSCYRMNSNDTKSSTAYIHIYGSKSEKGCPAGTTERESQSKQERFSESEIAVEFLISMSRG
jgi:hypothetical protein